MLSTPYGWVWVDTLVTLLIGCLLGLLSVKLAGLFAHAPEAEEQPLDRAPQRSE